MDELDGRNFIQYFGGRSLKTAARVIDDSLFRVALTDLEEMVRPTAVDFLIKSSFWRQGCSAAAGRSPKKVPISNLYSEICTYTHFWTNIINNPIKFAWILRQPFGLKHECEYTLSRLFDQIRAAIERPLVDKNGQVLASEVRLFLRCFEMLLRIARPEIGSSLDRSPSSDRSPLINADEASHENRLAELISKIKGDVPAGP